MNGKSVVITGGSRGLGFFTAEAFLEAGADVLITGRSAPALEQAAARLSATSRSISYFVGDATDPGDIGRLAAETAERWPRVDVLVNNAGLYEPGGTLLELDLGIWNRALAANLTGPFLMTQALGRAMAEAGSGSIINVASTQAHGVDGNWAAYSTAKAGLLQLTKTIASELGPSGVRCNSVCPGYTDTEALKEDTSESLYEYLRTNFERLPLRRVVTTAEVAAACVFLGSDSASGITGIDICIDGGALAETYIAATFPR
jgi:3-oxoacyl-[acyl-carrier protein] reductase